MGTRDRLRRRKDKNGGKKGSSTKATNTRVRLQKSSNVSPKSTLTVGSLLMKGDVLIVGDGDFSFSRSLAMLRKTGKSTGKLICSSYDSEKTVMEKYSTADGNVKAIRQMATANSILHSIDAAQLHHRFKVKFDRVAFNFPHTGQQRVHLNRSMLNQFLESASKIIHKSPLGLIIITLKDHLPYSAWNVEELASQHDLVLKVRLPFDLSEFAGYSHRTTDPKANKLLLHQHKSISFVFAIQP